MEKLKAGSSDYEGSGRTGRRRALTELVNGRDSILIDLSSWYKDSLAPKIELIQRGIEEKRLLSFRYYGPKGESDREIEPYYLIFKWASWYVWGWCRKREDFRMFKLNRMEELKLTEEVREDREVPVPELSDERIFPAGCEVKVEFQPEMRWRLVEKFGPDCFETQPDGTLLFQRQYGDDENLINWLLTFRDQARVLEPEKIRQEILQIGERVAGIYREGGKRK